MLFRSFGVIGFQHLVFEAEQGPRIDLEREVEVDGAVAGFLGVKVDLPQLAQRVGLDEVALVVHVEAVVDRMALQVGDESCDIDDSHSPPPACLSDAVTLPSGVVPTDGLTLLHEVADAVHEAFRSTGDLGPSGRRDGQYAFDVVANEAALPLLRRAGVGVLSEESEPEAGSGS